MLYNRSHLFNLSKQQTMSKTREKILNTSLQLKSEHLDAMHLVNRFVAICRDIHQTPKQFEKSMHELYKEAKNYGF